jgi:RING finger family protein
VKRCQICKTLIREDEATTTCADCDTAHHQECWEGVGGCSTYGCRAAPRLEKAPAPSTIGRGWGDKKECPSCHASIGSSLMVCLCGAQFPWADPMTSLEYDAWMSAEGKAKDYRRMLVILFALTLSGIAAPLTGPLAGIMAWRSHDALVGEHGSFLALGYGAAVISVVYSLIFLLLWSGF